jgi:hypothetical protein
VKGKVLHLLFIGDINTSGRNTSALPSPNTSKHWELNTATQACLSQVERALPQRRASESDKPSLSRAQVGSEVQEGHEELPAPSRSRTAALAVAGGLLAGCRMALQDARAALEGAHSLWESHRA